MPIADIMPSESQLLEDLRASVTHYNNDLSPVSGSRVLALCRGFAHLISQSSYEASKTLGRLVPGLASDATIDALAGLYGLVRRTARPARQIYIAVGCEDSDVVFASGSGITDPWGRAYTMTSMQYSGTLVESTYYYVGWMDAVDAGTQGNLTRSCALTVTSPPAGVIDNAATVLQSPRICGLDDETTEELLSRLIAALQGAPGQANPAYYTRLGLQQDAVGDCYVYRGIRDTSSVMLALAGPRAPHIRWSLTDDDTRALNRVLVANRGAGHTAEAVLVKAYGDLTVGTYPNPYGYDITVEVESADGYGRDWGTTTTASLAGNASSNIVGHDHITITVSDNPADEGLEVGHYVYVKCLAPWGSEISEADWYTVVQPYYTIAVRKVVSITYTDGKWAIVLDEPLPTRGLDRTDNYKERLYPAGPGTRATVQAIEQFFAELGPADMIDLEPVHPAQRKCDVNIALLNRAVLDVSVDGVLINETADWTPASDITLPTSFVYLDDDGVWQLSPLCARITTLTVHHTNLNE